MEAEVRTILKSNPAQVIGLAAFEEGISESLETILKERVDTEFPAPVYIYQKLKPLPGHRPQFEYITLKGHDKASLVLGLRANTGSAVNLRTCERVWHGWYRGRHTEQQRNAFTRSLIGQVKTDYKVGYFGSTHTVQLIQLHRHFARDSWPDQLSKFWDWLALKLKDVDVLMGDFGAALFCVIPELRSREVTIDLAAWFPWKAPDGTPCADSCGIFVREPTRFIHTQEGA